MKGVVSMFIAEFYPNKLVAIIRYVTLREWKTLLVAMEKFYSDKKSPNRKIGP